MLNRVIGVLVILALGVLIYPFAFNAHSLHDHFNGHPDSIHIPDFPSAKTQNDTIKALHQNTEEAENKAKIAKLYALKQKKPSNKPIGLEVKDKKHVKAGLKNVAWVVHIGTYREKIDALSLVNQLRAKGYNAFIHQMNAAFGEAVEVYIGPETKRDAAAMLATKLAKETKLSGVVKTYKLLSA